MSDIEKTPPTIIVPGVREAMRSDIVYAVCEENKKQPMSAAQSVLYSGMPAGLESKLVEVAISEWQPEYAQMPLEAVKSDLEDRVKKSSAFGILTGIFLTIVFLPVLPIVIAGVCAWYVIDKANNGRQLAYCKELEVTFEDLKA